MDLVNLQEVELRKNNLSLLNSNICEKNINKEEYNFANTLICITFRC